MKDSRLPNLTSDRSNSTATDADENGIDFEFELKKFADELIVRERSVLAQFRQHMDSLLEKDVARFQRVKLQQEELAYLNRTRSLLNAEKSEIKTRHQRLLSKESLESEDRLRAGRRVQEEASRRELDRFLTEEKNQYELIKKQIRDREEAELQAFRAELDDQLQLAIANRRKLIHQREAELSSQRLSEAKLALREEYRRRAIDLENRDWPGVENLRLELQAEHSRIVEDLKESLEEELNHQKSQHIANATKEIEEAISADLATRQSQSERAFRHSRASFERELKVELSLRNLEFELIDGFIRCEKQRKTNEKSEELAVQTKSNITRSLTQKIGLKNADLERKKQFELQATLSRMQAHVTDDALAKCENLNRYWCNLLEEAHRIETEDAKSTVTNRLKESGLALAFLRIHGERDLRRKVGEKRESIQLKFAKEAETICASTINKVHSEFRAKLSSALNSEATEARAEIEKDTKWRIQRASLEVKFDCRATLEESRVRWVRIQKESERALDYWRVMKARELRPAVVKAIDALAERDQQLRIRGLNELAIDTFATIRTTVEKDFGDRVADLEGSLRSEQEKSLEKLRIASDRRKEEALFDLEIQLKEHQRQVRSDYDKEAKRYEEHLRREERAFFEAEKKREIKRLEAVLKTQQLKKESDIRARFLLQRESMDQKLAEEVSMLRIRLEKENDALQATLRQELQHTLEIESGKRRTQLLEEAQRNARNHLEEELDKVRAAHALAMDRIDEELQTEVNRLESQMIHRQKTEIDAERSKLMAKHKAASDSRMAELKTELEQEYVANKARIFEDLARQTQLEQEEREAKERLVIEQSFELKTEEMKLEAQQRLENLNSDMERHLSRFVEDLKDEESVKLAHFARELDGREDEIRKKFQVARENATQEMKSRLKKKILSKEKAEQKKWNAKQSQFEREFIATIAAEEKRILSDYRYRFAEIPGEMKKQMKVSASRVKRETLSFMRQQLSRAIDGLIPPSYEAGTKLNLEIPEITAGSESPTGKSPVISLREDD